MIGLGNLAGNELWMKYEYGMMVYLNGIEMYGDKMNVWGEVSYWTVWSGSYCSLDYESIVRNGNDISDGSELLWIEVDFT